jgi:uncharacterized protein involved in exopolysaccharide biosynthesis
MDTSSSFDFAEYVAAVKRRRALIAGLALPIVMIAVAFAVGLPDVYRSTALIKFGEAEVSGEVKPANETTYADQFADQYVASLTNSVLSSENLHSILDAVQIRPDQQTNPGAALAEVADNTSVDMVRAEVLDPFSGREREVISAFTVSYESRDPAQAQQVALWLTEAFMRASRKILEERADAASQFYASEAERFRLSIGGLESKLADFKTKNYGRLPELAGANLNVLDRTERDLENVQLQLQTLSQQRIFLLQQLEQARSEGPGTNLLPALEAELSEKQAVYDENHPDIVALRRKIESLRAGGPASANLSLPEQLTQQKAVLAASRQRYSDDHPDVKRILRNIESLEARIARGETAPSGVGSAAASQLRTQINAINTEQAALQARAAELRGKLTEFEGRMEATPLVEREYQTLTRDLDLARKKYDELLASQMDADLKKSAISGGRADELKLVQPASRPSTPAKPARVSIVIIGLILAVIFAVGAATVAESLDQNVRGTRDVRRLLAVAPLATIPHIRDSLAQRRLIMRLSAITGCVAIGTLLLVVAIRVGVS